MTTCSVINERNDLPDSHFFSTFFFTKLTQPGVTVESMMPWLPANVNHMFIPVHSGYVFLSLSLGDTHTFEHQFYHWCRICFRNHWSLAAIINVRSLESTQVD